MIKSLLFFTFFLFSKNVFCQKLDPPPLPSSEGASSAPALSGGFGLGFGAPMGGGTSNPSGGADDGMQEKAYVGNEAMCPFKESKDDVARSALSGVINELNKLSAKCPQIKADVVNLEIMIQRVDGTAKALQMNSGVINANCNNYKFILQKEFESMVKNPDLKEKSDRYSKCKTTDQKCFENNYYESLGNFANSCRTALSVEKNRIAKQNLESLANQTEQIINKSKQCSASEDIASGVTSIGINSITAIAALTPGAGLAGTLVGLSGRILSSLAAGYFSRNSPKNAVDALKGEERFSDLACAYYAIQNRALNCDKQNIYLPTKPTKTPCDEVEADNLVDIRNLRDRIASLKVPQKFENLMNTMNSEVVDLEGGPSKKKTLLDLLIEASASQQKVGMPEIPGVGQQAAGPSKKLNQLLSRIKKHSKTIANLSEEEKKKRNDFFGRTLTEQDRKTLEKADEILRDHWKSQDAGTDWFTALENTTSRDQLVEAGYKIALASQDIDEVQEDPYQRRLMIAQGYMNKHFKSQFEDRLSNLQKTYQNNKGQANKSQKLSDLAPILRICSLNASIFLTNTTSDLENNWAINQVIAPSGTYEEVCKQFECNEGESPLKLFKPDTTKQSKLDLTQYQCNAVSNQTKAFNALRENIKKYGEPCKTN
jgi:hypothetical protein